MSYDVLCEENEKDYLVVWNIITNFVDDNKNEILKTMANIRYDSKDEYKMSMEELDAKIQKGVEDYCNGGVIRKLQTESSEEFLNRLCTM